ncbi:hypothetical protein MPSEU_000894000 [Mayamaea pseudoterrestris]|nr:hypothetical protein MPSEU_000894000 [Mayamaea pseudoterrestris]
MRASPIVLSAKGTFCLWLTAVLDVSLSFQRNGYPSPYKINTRRHAFRNACQLYGCRAKTLERTSEYESLSRNTREERQQDDVNINGHQSSALIDPSRTALTTALATVTAAATSSQALASNIPEISQGYLDPNNFNPVCPASDFFYRFLQTSAINVVGRESFIEYGPLIAGGLLRVRLELCVVESFFNEAVIPFIKQNGLNWVLPLHETVETFLAGTVFAIATTFILVGSTKILIVIATYTDFLIGLPFRLFGGFAFDRAMGKPVTLDIGFGPFKTRVIGPVDKADGAVEKSFTDLGPAELVSVIIFGTAKFAGQIVGVIREGLDALDVFVGRYLVIWASLYIGLKFVHFKILPDFP